MKIICKLYNITSIYVYIYIYKELPKTFYGVYVCLLTWLSPFQYSRTTG